MDLRTARIIITVTVATYLITLVSGGWDIDDAMRVPDSVQYHGISRRSFDRNVLRLLYRNYDRVRRGHAHMSDAGYGSRVQAGSKVANALIAHHIYGAYGPGRRKRDPKQSKMAATGQIPYYYR